MRVVLLGCGSSERFSSALWNHGIKIHHLAMDQYLYMPFLGG